MICGPPGGLAAVPVSLKIASMCGDRSLPGYGDPMERPDRSDMAAGDELPPEQPPAGENVCPDCEGSGRADGETCATCRGRGYVEEAVGGG